MGVVVHSNNVRIGLVVGVLLSRAFHKGRKLFFLITSILVYSFSCLVCGVGRDVDTSMFIRTVASPETLNG
jgi:hypothetical protein